MLKKILGSASLLALVLLSSCGEYKTTDSGLRYNIVIDSAGAAPKEGEAIFFACEIYRVEEGKEDSLVHKSESDAILIEKEYKKGSFEEGLRTCSKGDSVIFLVNIDTFFTFNGQLQQKPPFLEKAQDLRFHIKVTRIASKEEVEMERQKREEMMRQRQEAMRQQAGEMNKQKIIEAGEYKKTLLASDSIKAQLKKDDAAIQEYLKKNKISAKKTQNGVYYVVKKAGNGTPNVVGDSITVGYKGMLMDGSVFDSSEGRPPFQFLLGALDVIVGWDEVVGVLRKGDVVTVYIPSALAYGSPGAAGGRIPPNANLIFDIEVIK